MNYRIEIEYRIRELQYPDSLVASSSTGGYPRITEYRGCVRSLRGRVVFEGNWLESRSEARSEAHWWVRNNA